MTQVQEALEEFDALSERIKDLRQRINDLETRILKEESA